MPRYKHNLPSVLVPQSDICVPLTIPNHPDYVALLIRAIRLLTLDRNYDRDENHSAIVVRDQWMTRTYQPLIDALEAAQGCFDCEPGDCEAYPNSANFITYSPQNPFSEPDLVPSGYVTPPFTLFKNFPLIGWLSTYFPSFTEELTGYLPDDIIVDITSLPAGSWTEPALGVPQIAIDISGNGIVELHMINFPLGGRAIVTIDTQPNVGDILGGILGNAEFSIELNRDIISIPPETVPVSIFEVEIDDEIPTNHTIYISFVPTIDDAFIPLNFGGGIRKIVLCGLDTQIMPIVEEIRLNNCVLEQKINGQWIPVGSVNDCITAITNPMQANIATNTANIATNTANIATNAGNIAANTANIATNADDIDTVELSILGINAQIVAINNTLAAYGVDIDQHLTLIENLQQYVSDHESRITQLENSTSPSGGAAFKITPYIKELTVPEATTGITWILHSQGTVSHTFTYNNAFVVVEIRGDAGGTNQGQFRPYVSGEPPSAMTNLCQNIDAALQLSDLYPGLSGQTRDVGFEYHSTGANIIVNNQTMQIFIIEWAENIEPVTILNFDDPLPLYTLEAYNGTTNPTGSTTVAVAAEGNTGNCFKVTFDGTLYVASGQIHIDLGEPKQIAKIEYEFKYDNIPFRHNVNFYDDDNLVSLGVIDDTNPPPDGQWNFQSTNGFDVWTGGNTQHLTMYIPSGGNSSPTSRIWWIDNIKIYHQ